MTFRRIGRQSYLEEVDRRSSLNTVMLGPRRSGKSTLLTVMAERLESVSSNRLVLKDAGGFTLTKFRKLLEDLQSIEQQDGGDYAPSISGDEIAHLYRLQLMKPDSKDGVTLLFQDYPGSWLSASHPDHSQVQEFVRRANVAIVAIDAPYLIEENGKYHQVRNMPESIATLLRGVDPGPELVILCPTRCERYVLRYKRELVDRVREEYSGVIGLCAMRNIPLAILPVQTTGCLQFAGFRPDPANVENPELPKALFYPKSRPINYAPEGSDQPLRYVLNLAVQRYLQAKTQGFWGWLNSLFLNDSEFREAVREFSDGIKSGDGSYFSGWNHR